MLVEHGGGLGVDYDGSQTNFESSINYTLQEYANDVVYHIQSLCDDAKVPHPTIVSESGRAVVAYHSALIFNVLGVSSCKTWSDLVLMTEQGFLQSPSIAKLQKEGDSFRLHTQDAGLYSWWDYRMLGYQKNRGLRIDHILVSEALRPLVKACTIDRVPRKWDKPSDHTPVVVDLLQA